MRTLRICVLLLLCLQSVIGAEPPTDPSPAPPVPEGTLSWSSTHLEAVAEPMGRFVTFAFGITNVSRSTVSILGTESSCECTVAELPSKPWIFNPGDSGTIHVRMNITGRFGKLTKKVFVNTSHGRQTLTVETRIPLTPAPFNVSARQMDLAAAQKDPQAIFKGGCAACHSLPTIGRHGKSLFDKACGICHLAEHRAEMVPDLSTLARPRDATYWRTLVEHGKPGTLMPGFARERGGILEPNQVDSLVEYLLTAYPPATADPDSKQP